MSIFTRKVPEGERLNVLDLKYATQNQITTANQINLWYTLMRSQTQNISVWAQNTLNGYQPTPDRYWIKTCLDVIMIYVEADPKSEEQRFVWKTPGKNDVVTTAKITKDSVVLIKVFGDTLSYADGNKLIFVECQPMYKHPINIAFIDNFGLTQTVAIETGEWSSTYQAENKFKSISHDITYELGKTSNNILTVGDTTIPRELMLFYDGMIKSPAYYVVNEKLVIPTHFTNGELVADSFTKTYTITGNLQFDTINIPTLQYAYGELNINNL